MLFIGHVFFKHFDISTIQLGTYYLGELLIGNSLHSHLEIGDNFGDVGVHLVKVVVLGGRLPVLAPSHRVHNVLIEKRNEIFGQSTRYCCLPTWMRAK